MMKKVSILVIAFLFGFMLTACTPTEYTVSFDSDGGSAVAEQTVEEGNSATEPAAPMKEGFNFVHWFTDDETVAYDFDAEVTGDVELTAAWTAKDMFTVAFDSDGGSEVTSQSIMDGEMATEPEAPTKEGYDFDYWYEDDDAVEFDFETAISGETVLMAKWTEKTKYTVTFDAGIGSAVDSVEVYEGSTVVLPEDPMEAAHDFVYWYLDAEDTAFDDTTPITEDITLTAKWEPKAVFTVTFDANGGSEVAAEEVMEGYMATMPEDPFYLGFAFVRWYESDDTVPFDFTAPITDNVTLTALWSERPVFTVTFDTMEGTDVAAQNIIEEEMITPVEDPTKEGYRFMYWYLDDDTAAFDVTTPITGDVTLTAKWEMTYAVTFETDGGTEVAAQNLLGDEVTVMPEEPTRVGYRFVRWYSTDSEVDFVFGETVSEDVVVTALWQKTYTVRFYSLGQLLEQLTMDEGEVIAMPADPTNGDEGYIFKYWYNTDSEVAYDFGNPLTTSINLFARWETPTERLIMEDMDAYGLLLDGAANPLPMPGTGEVQGSTMRYYAESDYISEEGIVLPLPASEPEGTTGTWRVKFTLSGESYFRNYEVPLEYADEVVLAESRIVPFENLTTEYDIADSDLTLYFETDGSVPYVRIDDFFGLLDGFIDPALDITYTKTADNLNIFYQYYSEDEDITYDLILDVNATENTITTNDPGFYWAYIYSTETNYGRHIEYVQDHPDESYEEGSDVIYDLDDFNMDIVVHEGEVMIPYYMANQLFAGSAYYNVYYNYDGLYGIYSLPSDGSRELNTIQDSSLSNSDIPVDLLIHTFDMLAFNLDNLYGLKDIMDVDTYYDLLYDMKDDLLVQDAEDLDFAIRDLLLQGLDEPHTSYGYHSYFNDQFFDGPPTNTLAVYGERFVQWYYDGLVDTDDAIGAKWGEATSGWNVNARPDYWWVSDDVVMLSLNGFSTVDMEESATYDVAIMNDMLEVADSTVMFSEILEGNKFFYYNNSDENNRIINVLVKGASEAYVDTYIADLLADGYTHVVEATGDALKTDGYYTKTVGDIDYMVVPHYDTEFDIFHVGIATYTPASYGGSWAVTREVKPLIDADSAVYMEFMLQEIEEENPDFTDIILDLSWNTGGNVGALYRVVGFITDSPFAVTSIDGDTGGAGTSFVDIVGVPDYSHKTWHLLTTPTSFSAANSLATIFRANDLGEIIGVQTGGGACSITPILLPNGTAFTMSSNNISAIRVGSGTEEDPYVYLDVEFGITPDHEIDIEDIFITTVLLEIINGIE